MATPRKKNSSTSGTTTEDRTMLARRKSRPGSQPAIRRTSIPVTHAYPMWKNTPDRQATTTVAPARRAETAWSAIQSPNAVLHLHVTPTETRNSKAKAAREAT